MPVTEKINPLSRIMQNKNAYLHVRKKVQGTLSILNQESCESCWTLCNFVSCLKQQLKRIAIILTFSKDTTIDCLQPLETVCLITKSVANARKCVIYQLLHRNTCQVASIAPLDCPLGLVVYFSCKNCQVEDPYLLEFTTRYMKNC